MVKAFKESLSEFKNISKLKKNVIFRSFLVVPRTGLEFRDLEILRIS